MPTTDHEETTTQAVTVEAVPDAVITGSGEVVHVRVGCRPNQAVRVIGEVRHVRVVAHGNETT